MPTANFYSSVPEAARLLSEAGIKLGAHAEGLPSTLSSIDPVTMVAPQVDNMGLLCTPTTLPATDDDPIREQVLQTAVHVLATEAIALQRLSELYSSHPVAQNGFVNSVSSIATSIRSGGKLVVIGVGKSGKIGKKMVATFNSVGLLSVFMHPVEALHGDLGLLREVRQTENFPDPIPPDSPLLIFFFCFFSTHFLTTQTCYLHCHAFIHTPFFRFYTF
jgi:hypothetical protein